MCVLNLWNMTIIKHFLEVYEILSSPRSATEIKTRITVNTLFIYKTHEKKCLSTTVILIINTTVIYTIKKDNTQI